MTSKKALEFNEIWLQPKYSDIKSLHSINLNTLITRRYGLLNPFLTIVNSVDEAMATVDLGGVSIISHNADIDSQVLMVKHVYNRIYTGDFGAPYEDWGVMYDNWHSEIPYLPIVASVQIKFDENLERSSALIKAGANVIIIESDNVNSEQVKVAIERIKSIKDEVDVIVDNIITIDAAESVQEWGADGLIIRNGDQMVQNGFYKPIAQAIIDIEKIAKVPVIVDGHFTTSIDCIKALALGASVLKIDNRAFNLRHLREKIRESLAFAGSTDLGKFSPDWIQRAE